MAHAIWRFLFGKWELDILFLYVKKKIAVILLKPYGVSEQNLVAPMCQLLFLPPNHLTRLRNSTLPIARGLSLPDWACMSVERPKIHLHNLIPQKVVHISLSVKLLILRYTFLKLRTLPSTRRSHARTFFMSSSEKPSHFAILP